MRVVSAYTKVAAYASYALVVDTQDCRCYHFYQHHNFIAFANKSIHFFNVDIITLFSIFTIKESSSKQGLILSFQELTHYINNQNDIDRVGSIRDI